MKVPVSWLREYVDFDLPVEELARRLVFSSCEVDRVVRRGVPGGANLEYFVVGKVLEADKHPNADKLQLTKVDVGDGEPRSITVRPGDTGQAAALRHVIAREARRRGYVPVATAVFHRLRAWLEEALPDRALVLMVGGGGHRRPPARTPNPLWLLVRAATLNPRPHVLVTIAPDAVRHSTRQLVVRELHERPRI